MCGIFSLLNFAGSNNSFPDECFVSNAELAFYRGKSRGPETSIFNTDFITNFNVLFGFHRLAINGIDNLSNQPIIINNILLICNGEIYNYKQLYQELALHPDSIFSNSDCEVIIHMYLKYGIEYTLQQLDGEFAFTLFDFRDKNNTNLFVARDPYGVRPLFMGGSYNYTGFASEMKQLHAIDSTEYIHQFTPSTYMHFKYNSHKNNWTSNNVKYVYTTFSFRKQPELRMEDYFDGIRKNFIEAVKKRVENCERPVACLLSGGLDSSLVTSIVSKLSSKRIETYSIGLKGSEDLKYAKIVADFLGTKHTEIVITEEEFFDRIPEVIKVIESYDTTTVRASVGNYLVAEYISQNSDAKVIINGDGSDELMGGYLYFTAAPDSMEFDKECMKLLNNIHYFDGLRSDRCISANGLEPRTPFLDRGWVEYYLSIPIHIRNHNNIYRNVNRIEKFLIRNAFDIKNNSSIIKQPYNTEYKEFLPKEILYRKKEAFSDGVSSKDRSWYKIIQEKVELLNVNGDKNLTKEQVYYLNIFNKIYPGRNNIIPYYWMPNFVQATDASARTLAMYK